jgi:diguanylate cyclase (GGDEF)-like protein/PAS domain S-box-containing protein
MSVPNATRALAKRWCRALDGTSFVAMPSVAVEEFLAGQVETLAVAVADGPECADAGSAAGVALVQAGFTAPEVVARSAEVLQDLPAVAGCDDPRGRHRLVQLVGGLGAGYATALRDRALAQQESIRKAALEARDEAETASRASQARFRAVFDHAGVAIAMGDAQGRLVEANPALGGMLGVTPDQLRGRKVLEFFHPDDVAAIQRQVYDRLGGVAGAARLEVRFRHGDRTWGWTRLAVSLVPGGQGQAPYLLAIGEDVTEQRRLAAKLRHQAGHDPLTGLPNRTQLYERIDQALATPDPQRRVGLCFLDLDGFKVVNDTWGHLVGDRLLVAVAERLRACVTGAGHLVARVGGDEFVVLVDDDHRSGPDGAAGHLAEQILTVLAEPIRVGTHELRVTASIGVVDRPAAEADADTLMQAADASLYWAKRDGRSRWVGFDEQRGSRDLLRSRLAADLPQAIEKDEFTVDFQPLVALADQRLVGVEALLRWRHPELGLLGPELFIPIAEQTGDIVALGRWVLHTACRHAAAWRSLTDRAPFVSVNVSVRQLTDTDVYADVVDAVATSGLHPADLQLELTESTMLSQHADTVRLLGSLAGAGVRLAIDDFGTGYSSLAHMRTLPVHAIKLAGPFIDGLRDPSQVDAKAERFVAGVISIGHALNLAVTAEDIETAHQAERLHALGCDLGQGRHFGPPVPAAAIADHLMTDR